MTYEKMPDLSLAQTGEKGRKKPLPVWVIYLLPSLLIFALFTIYPFLKTVVTAFSPPPPPGR